MVNAVEFLIGLTIGAGVVALYYFIRSRTGGELAARHRDRLKQALLMAVVCGVLATIGEIVIRL
jgi:hypothetical protein